MSEKKRKTSIDIACKSYYHPSIAHFTTDLRTQSNTDLMLELQEGAFRPIKKYIYNIKKDNAFKAMSTKSSCKKFIDIFNRMEKEFNGMSKINFIKSDADEKYVFIENDLIYDENNSFKDYFVYILQHLGDTNPNRFIKRSDGLYVKCGLPNYRENIDSMCMSFPPNTNQIELLKQITEKMIERNDQYKNTFLYEVCKSKHPFFWVDLKKSIWWMKDDYLIDCQGITKIKYYLKWMDQHVDVDYLDSNELKLRTEAKRLRILYASDLDRLFPEPDLSIYNYFFENDFYN